MLQHKPIRSLLDKQREKSERPGRSKARSKDHQSQCPHVTEQKRVQGRMKWDVKITVEEELEHRPPTPVFAMQRSLPHCQLHWLEYSRSGSLPGKGRRFLSSTPEQKVPGSAASRLVDALCPQLEHSHCVSL